MSDPYDPFKDPLLLDHEADGIRELDNTLPRWWVWLFNICILFAVGYLGYYHVFHLGDLQAAQYVRENKQGEAVKAPCHRADGGGLVGPNLCDDYWIHGSNFVDNLRTIVNGVPGKGMLTWRGVLKPSEIHAVASFIYTLRGTHPPNPKPPENQSQPAAPNIYE
jgi:cytochrome c oxidase cbb3-type subunit 3